MLGIKCECPTITLGADEIVIEYGVGLTVKLSQDKITCLIDNEEVAYFTDKRLDLKKYDAIPQLVFRMLYAKLLEDVQKYGKEYIVNAGECIVPTDKMMEVLKKLEGAKITIPTYETLKK